MSDFYVKDKESVRLDLCNRFIYEVIVYVYYDNIFSMVNHKYYSSEEEIHGIIKNYYVTDNIEICCEMYSAPESWLIDNDFILYKEPEKRKNGRQKTKTIKQRDTSTPN